jgi:hypothetical protein
MIVANRKYISKSNQKASHISSECFFFFLKLHGMVAKFSHIYRSSNDLATDQTRIFVIKTFNYVAFAVLQLTFYVRSLLRFCFSFSQVLTRLIFIFHFSFVRRFNQTSWNRRELRCVLTIVLNLFNEVWEHWKLAQDRKTV